MIDPTKYMPVLQCYKCYNVTTRASEGGRMTRHTLPIFGKLVEIQPRFYCITFAPVNLLSHINQIQHNA